MSLNYRKYMVAYGMNTNLYEMQYRCPKAKSLGAVTLQDHKFAFRTHADVQPSRGDTVECVLWSITADCEAALDRLEGFPHYYKKKNVIVQHGDKKITAMIYYMADTRSDSLSYPGEHYARMLFEGYTDHGISHAQIDHALDEIDAYYAANPQFQYAGYTD